MPKGNIKTEGGSGGKLGHSNMSHWELTEEIKRDSKKLRRENEKREIRDETDALGIVLALSWDYTATFH